MFSTLQSLMKQYYPNAIGISGDKNFFNGYAISIPPYSTWPCLYFSFDGVVIRVPPSIYFLTLTSEGQTYYYLGIGQGSSSV